MRYLIYSYCFETPHFETELEIALKLINQRHEVFFLVCRADLKTCVLNPQHSSIICAVCKSKIFNGLKTLNLPKQNILYLTRMIINEAEYADALTSFESLRAYKYKNSDIGLAVVSSLVSRSRDHYFDISEYTDQIKIGLETSIMVHENFELILKEVKPDGVIMFNGRFLEARPAMRLCEKYKIDFYTHERGGDANRYMFRKNSTPHAISFVKKEIEELWLNALPDKEKIGVKFFEDRRNKVIQTWHVFTENQVDGNLPVGFNPSKRNIGIFNSSMDEYEGIADFSNKLYVDDNDGIERICKSFLEYPEFHFYLRVHPNLKGLVNTQTKGITEIGKKYKNLTIIAADDAIDTYALMEAVEAVITFGSTIGIEALYWNKSSVLLGRSFYEDIEGIITPINHEDAVNCIKSEKSIPSNLAAVKFGYWCLTYGTKFDFFESESLFKGKFLGKSINASLLSRLKRKIAVKFE